LILLSETVKKRLSERFLVLAGILQWIGFGASTTFESWPPRDGWGVGLGRRDQRWGRHWCGV